MPRVFTKSLVGGGGGGADACRNLNTHINMPEAIPVNDLRHTNWSLVITLYRTVRVSLTATPVNTSKHG
jgi:hypothetical protein